MNTKLKQLADDLQDGGVITDYLEDDAIALLGQLSYEEILEAVTGNHDDAQNVFWAAAQHLAGDQIDEYLPPVYKFKEAVEADTPQRCADQWNELDVSDKHYYDAKFISLNDVRKTLNKWCRENGAECQKVARSFLEHYSPEVFQDLSVNEHFLINLAGDRIIVFSRETDNVVELTPNSLVVLDEWEPQKGLLRSEPLAREGALTP